MAPFKAYKIQPDDFKHETDVEEGVNTNLSEFDSGNDEDERSSILSFSSSSDLSSQSSKLNLWTLEILDEEDRVIYDREDALLGLKLCFFR